MEDGSGLPCVKCIIIDDEEMAIKVIESHLSHVPEFEIVGTFHSAIEAFLALDRIDMDVIFLDIQMPKMTGVEMINIMRKRPLIVLTTAHREYALDGFDLEVVDYLLKPIGLNRFLKSIIKLKRILNPSTIINRVENEHIFIKSNRTHQKVNIDSILHVEAIKNHIRVVTTEQTYISLVTLTEFETKLPECFIRVHRSFVVNKMKILEFSNNKIVNQNTSIPIGRTYKESVMQALTKLTD